MKIFHCVNVFTLFIVIYPQGVLNCVLPMNTVHNDFRFIGFTSSPKHPSPDEFWQAVHCDEYSTERCRRDSTNHATNETKGGGGGWRDVGGARGSHRIVGVISGVALRWRRQMSASARRRPLPHPLQAGQPINCTWTHRGDSRKKLFHTL